MLKVTTALLAATILATVAGCAAFPSTASPSTAVPSPRPSASAESHSGVSDAAMVMRFAATATADSGETAHLELTVYAPHPLTAAERASLTSAPCVDWQKQFPDAVGLPIRLTTSAVKGTWPKYHFVAVESSYLSTAHQYTASAWTGSWQTTMAACSDGVAVIPGQASGVLLTDPNRAPDDDSWGRGTWGLTSEFGEDRPLKVSISDCSIELGSAASASPHLSAMTTADAAHGCTIGWVD